MNDLFIKDTEKTDKVSKPKKTKSPAKNNEPKSGPPTLFLIDGSALIYRGFFAFIRNPLINSRGENTSAPFGFANSLVKLLNEEKPDYVAVIFDTKAPTFRHEMYSEYKSTRAKMPDELVEQLPRIKEIVTALNIPSYELEGYEADDIIGAFAKEGEKAGLKVWIASGDKDFCQLVTDNIHIYNSKKASEPAQRLDREGVKEKMGVYPERIIDLLALMGDSSDNVPGIAGVGPKTAIKLLAEYGTLEDVLDHAEDIAAKGLRAKVLAGKENALLSKRLVTIKDETPVEFSLDELIRKKPHEEQARELFAELEFNALLKNLFDAAESKPNPAAGASRKGRQVKYTCVTSIEQLKQLIDSALELHEVAIDTETTSLNQMTAELVGVSLCLTSHEAYYIPLGHTNGPENNLPKEAALKELSRLLLAKSVEKVGQNIKYDMHILSNAGLTIKNVGFDTMLAAYVINPSQRRYSLDNQAQDRFNYQMQPISDLIGTGKKQISFAETSVESATAYAAEDADLTYRLRGVLEPEIIKLNLSRLFFEIEMPLITVLCDMEREGVRIDREFLADMSDELDKSIADLKLDIYREVGSEFNLNSPQQLAKALFEDLKLPTRGKTAKKTGYSTDVRVLEELAQIHPAPQKILEYRQYTKLKGTYVDALPALINETTGRVHTTFNQTIAATGRLSSTDPNLQNIPIRTEIGSRIRKAFIPRDKNFSLLIADYSQIELRILAHVCEDVGLIDAFNKEQDIHARTASEVFDVELEDVTSEQRRLAKTANFAVIYGVSAYGLAQQSAMDVSEAKKFIETYFERYPGIKTYMDETIAFAQEKGYVETLTGRRRYIPDINSKNFQIRQFAERIAVNTPIQGAAADMIKIAMLRVHEKLSEMKSAMILQVHDELVFDAHESEIDALIEIVRTEMQSAMELKVPLVVDIGVGNNWLEAK